MTIAPNGGTRDVAASEDLESVDGDEVDEFAEDPEVGLGAASDEVPVEVDPADWLDSAVQPELDTDDYRR